MKLYADVSDDTCVRVSMSVHDMTFLNMFLALYDILSAIERKYPAHTTCTRLQRLTGEKRADVFRSTSGP